MALRLSKITLKTAQLGKLGQFLSQIFETDIHPHEAGALLKKGEQDFLLISSKTAQVKGVSFTFNFDVREDFDFFYNKVQFLFYRQGENNNPFVLIENEEEFYFSVKDPEGREWFFTFRK